MEGTINNKNKNQYIGFTVDSRKYKNVKISEYPSIVKNNGGNALQIFLTEPSKYSQNKHSKRELIRLKKNIVKYDMKVVVHGSFMINFCNPIYSNKCRNAMRLLISDLNNSVTIGALGVIIHMGKNCKSLNISNKRAIRNYVKAVRCVLQNSDEKSTIIFETGAGVGTEICSEISELYKLYNMFSEEEKKRIKICIDTCHVFSSGENDFKDKNENFCSNIEDMVGWENISCVHLNDSKTGFSEKKDRHADLTSGNINDNGLKYFIKKCSDNGIPIILETPCDTDLCHGDQIQIVKSWLNHR